MANDAHLIGLLAGVILGAAFGLLHRFQASDADS
jgi:membrane associated rhomboid family serine protease